MSESFGRRKVEISKFTAFLSLFFFLASTEDHVMCAMSHKISLKTVWLTLVLLFFPQILKLLCAN